MLLRQAEAGALGLREQRLGAHYIGLRGSRSLPAGLTRHHGGAGSDEGAAELLVR